MANSTSIVVRVSPQLRSRLASLAADSSSSMSSLIVELIEKALTCQPTGAEQHLAEAKLRVNEVDADGVEVLLAQIQRRLSDLEVHTRVLACGAPHETSFSDSASASWAAPDPTRRSDNLSPPNEPVKCDEWWVCTSERSFDSAHQHRDTVERALADFAE